MRTTPIALIEFHWLAPAPVRERRAAPKRPAPTYGYRLPGRGWHAFADGLICFGRHPPIVFFQALPEAPEEAPRPCAVWHRIH